MPTVYRFVRVYFALAALSLPAFAPTTAQAAPVKLKRVLGTTGRANVTLPQPLTLKEGLPLDLKAAPKDLTAPQYAVLSLGPKDKPSEFTIVLDESSATPRLFVDANGNGDLTDDPLIEWKTVPYRGGDGKEYARTEGFATVQARYGAETLPFRVGLLRYDKSDPARALYRDSLLVFSDTVCEGDLTLGTKSYHILLTDILVTGDFRGKAEGGSISGVQMLIDVNGNGIFERRGESYDIAKPFNIKGTTYEIRRMSASGLTFEVVKSARSVPEIPPPPDLRPGQKALPFTAQTTDGKKVNFPSDYKGRLVLLYFWASWCGDCRAELPNLFKAVEAVRGQALDVLGVSLDNANQAEALAKFCAENHITWPQIYDGKRWEAALAQLYFVQNIPGALLVDGDTGEILAAGDALLETRLADTLKTALGKKK